MATTAGNAALALGDVTRYTEMRYRLFFLLGALVVYRIGTFVPVPGIDPVALARLFDSQEGTILGLFNMFSGGALERLSIFAMGVMPYISASIIMQMMAVVVPSSPSVCTGIRFRKRNWPAPLGAAGHRPILKACSGTWGSASADSTAGGSPQAWASSCW